MRLFSILVLTICLCHFLFIGCQALKGEDGDKGGVGAPGVAGLDGSTGNSAANDFPCLGCITNESIQDTAVEKRAIYQGAVTRDKIRDGAVTDMKIADGAVTSPKIMDNSVSPAKIADGAVQGYHIESTECIAGQTAECGEVQAGHILDDSVVYGKLADNAVEAGDIQDNSVQPAFGAFQGHIQAGAVGSQDIADDAITTSKIADNSVDTRHIQTGAVNHMWQIKRSDWTYILGSQTSWTELSSMRWYTSNGHGGHYLVKFNASFSCDGYSSPYYGNNCEGEIRLVGVTAAGAKTELARHSVFSSGSSNESITDGSCEYHGKFACWGHHTNYCTMTHYHRNYWEYVGTVSLNWAGSLNPSWTTLKVEWRKRTVIDSQYLDQRDGDRILTVIEFQNAAFNP